MVKKIKLGFVQITGQAEKPVVLGEKKNRCPQSTDVVWDVWDEVKVMCNTMSNQTIYSLTDTKSGLDSLI